MQQQLPPPGRLVILAIAVRLLANVRVQQPSLVAGHLREAILQLNPAVFGRLNLRSSERETGFKPLQQMVVVAGLTIVAQNFNFRLHGGLFFCTPRSESTLRQPFMWCISAQRRFILP